MGLHGGDRKSRSNIGTLNLVDLGLTKNESSCFQLLAKVPEAELVKTVGALLGAP